MRNRKNWVNVLHQESGETRLVPPSVVKNPRAMKAGGLVLISPNAMAAIQRRKEIEAIMEANPAEPIPEEVETSDAGETDAPPIEAAPEKVSVEDASIVAMQFRKGLRKRYEDLFQKKVYNNWSNDQLIEKIEEKEAQLKAAE